jgi:hypothetical protein
MMEIKDNVTGQSMLEKGVWSSKSMWKAISSVAVGVFIITMIYAQFQQMATTIETLTNRIENQNDRLVAADEKAEVERDALEHRQRENEFGDVRQQSAIDANTNDSHKIGQTKR